MVRTTIITALVLCVVTGATVPAEAEQVISRATLKCPGSNDAVVKEILCEPGTYILATATCPDGRVAQDLMECPETCPECENYGQGGVALQRDERTARAERRGWFRWGFIPDYNHIGVDDGPAQNNVNLLFDFNLHLAGPAWFTFGAGPGAAWVTGGMKDDDDTRFNSTEYAGLRFAVPMLKELELSVIGRHSITFMPDGDLLNALMGEVQAAYALWSTPDFQLSIIAHGGAGGAWYPSMRTMYWWHGQEITDPSRAPDYEKPNIEAQDRQVDCHNAAWEAGGGMAIMF